MNSLLKNLGKILSTGLQIWTGIGPIVTPYLGNKGAAGVATVATDAATIESLILQVEVALQGKTGPEKLAAAINLIGPIIRTSEAVSNHKIADPVLMQQGIAGITQGYVDVLNSLDAGGVNKEVKQLS